MLKTKCILTQPQIEDGIRISIMSRHTLNDGVTPDIRITDNLYEFWCANLAPPGTLVGAFYQKRITFERYCNLYAMYLRQKNNVETIQNIAKYALTQNVTLLCIEESPKKCHRTLLLRECLQYVPELSYEIY